MRQVCSLHWEDIITNILQRVECVMYTPKFVIGVIIPGAAVQIVRKGF